MLFDQFKEPFILFANSYVRDIAAAEDIYMEAIMLYWEKRKDLPESVNIPAYVLTCVKNRAINYLRHLNVINEAEDQIMDQHTRELSFRISSLESCDPSELFTNELKQIIRTTLHEMPEQTRKIFFKSRYENKTYREIATDMNVSIKTVEFHIAKALKILRIKLKDYMPIVALFISC
ncbi:RNA polymerase sigma-70 factor [Bacteroides sp. AM07-16]|nr:RNA polymerase sigma-70 factor [Bacteroides sp. AM07-16]